MNTHRKFSIVLVVAACGLLSALFANATGAQATAQELELRSVTVDSLDEPIDFFGETFFNESLPLEAPTISEAPTINVAPMVDQRIEYPQEVSVQTGGAQQVTLDSRCCSKKTIGVNPNDEVWIVSARDCHCSSDLSCLDTKKLVGGQWQQADFSELTTVHSTDPSKQTLLYVHGNQTNYDWAQLRGMQFYENALADSADCRKPVRYVIWCWRADREFPRLLRDYKVKAERAVVAGRTLGKALAQFEDRNMTLTGFSLGAQVLMSALEEPMLQRCNSPETKFRVALIAAAVDPSFVCQRLGVNPVNCPVGETFIFTNKDDRAIKASRFVVRRDCPQANSTFRELAANSALPLGNIDVIEISTEIGPRHSVTRYANSPTLQRRLLELFNSADTIANP
jgi:hypothetical protein